MNLILRLSGQSPGYKSLAIAHKLVVKDIQHYGLSERILDYYSASVIIVIK